jgi:hypothetical protein
MRHPAYRVFTTAAAVTLTACQLNLSSDLRRNNPDSGEEQCPPGFTCIPEYPGSDAGNGGDGGNSSDSGSDDPDYLNGRAYCRVVASYLLRIEHEDDGSVCAICASGASQCWGQPPQHDGGFDSDGGPTFGYDGGIPDGGNRCRSDVPAWAQVCVGADVCMIDVHSNSTGFCATCLSGAVHCVDTRDLNEDAGSYPDGGSDLGGIPDASPPNVSDAG